MTTDGVQSNATGDCCLGLDALLWGKEKGLERPYPVVCHLVDTAAIAGALWDRLFSLRQRRALAARVGVSAPGMRRLVSFWAGLHDLGKISPPFQAMHEGSYQELTAQAGYEAQTNAERERLRHELATHWALTVLLPELGYPTAGVLRKAVHQRVAQLLGGHHGLFPPSPPKKEVQLGDARQPGLGRNEWDRQRRAHLDALRRVTRAEDVPTRLPSDVAVVVASLVVVADWLASQERFIAERLPAVGWSASRPEVEAHWQRAVEDAPGEISRARLGRVTYQKRAFRTQFPHIATPNPLQRSLREELPDLIRDPGLLVVCAPTGDGKTEAALHAASLLGRLSGASGLYFALPTMATADAMFRRVAQFAGVSVRGHAALTLLHSMAWLSRENALTDGAGRTVSQDVRTKIEAGEWLHAGRRGILAPLAVGTIDQALMGVLPLRYTMLRLFGLANKVFVVDEAHSYGPWMHSLLLRLLEWLGAMSVPVVLMSATLSGRTATSLISAYQRGRGLPPTPVVVGYPGWAYVDAHPESRPEVRSVTTARPRQLAVEVRRAVWDLSTPVTRPPEPGGQRHALLAAIASVVERGGCVLVCRTTVPDAQRTHRFLRHSLAGVVPPEDLVLLHSRYEVCRRREITDLVESRLGKPDPNAPPDAEPRRPLVLVATSIVEQSLDLDVDLVVSDLAPMAQLLQRAGRCFRHERGNRAPGVGTGPRLVVIDPVTKAGEWTVPRSWGDTYPKSWLRRTSHLLASLPENGVTVPDDVQRLVDDVYAEDFGERLPKAAQEELDEADLEHLGDELSQKALAKLVLVHPPAPDGDSDLVGFSPDEEREGIEELITTRLGADSERVVCVFEGADGRRSLTPDGRTPVPALREVPSQADLAVLFDHVVPLPGRWFRDIQAEAVPAGWEKHPRSAALRVLTLRQEGNRWLTGQGEGDIEYSELGLHRELWD
ncbi:CRISPR-associated endonuclease Cas3'' [Actinoalloteichus caeruleus]|uniref:CRISPR-associated endonuclease Cas3'' n=1 Tax=Actinoalloteichus cyanogriseus TaxID=2893586 RepID=UPI003AAFB73F